MLKPIYRHLKHSFHHPNYLILMVSLILVVIIPPFLDLLYRGELILYSLFGMTMLLGVIYTTTGMKEAMACFVVGLIGFTLFMVNIYENIILICMSAILNFSFFSYLFVKIIRFVLKEKEVDSNTIFACISGFFILGLSASILFSLANTIIDNAFSSPAEPVFYDFIYFSFVTLTTVGFGDIYPACSTTKSMTIMLGIIGQLYTTFLVAITVGKYLAVEAFKGD